MTNLSDCATENVITVSAATSIDDAIRLLKQHTVRHLPVVQDGLPVGMVSEGDVLAAVGGILSDQRVSIRDATVPHAGPTLVEQIMTTGIVALSPEEPIATAAGLMLERQIAAVVLTSNDRIVGIVTETDYLRQFFSEKPTVPDACRQQAVADHMTAEVVTAAPTDNVFTLMREMGKRMHHLPVVEDGKLVGILSGHDVHRALALDRIEQISDPDQRIRLMENYDAGLIMTENIETTTRKATLAEAARQMIENKIGALPVMEAGDLVGIITETDILRACVSAWEDFS